MLSTYKTCRIVLMEGRWVVFSTPLRVRSLMHGYCCCCRRQLSSSPVLLSACRSPNKLLNHGSRLSWRFFCHQAHHRKPGTRNFSCTSLVPYGRLDGGSGGSMMMRDLRSTTWYGVHCRCSNHCWSWCPRFPFPFSPNRQTTPWSLSLYLTRTP